MKGCFCFSLLSWLPTFFEGFASYHLAKLFTCTDRLQRKSVLQLAIQASCTWHVLAQKSFQLASKSF